MGRKWSIGRIEFDSAEEYEAGRRDIRKIKNMTKGLDLEDMRQAGDLYHVLRMQPFLFETKVGIAFRSYLLDKSEGKEISGSLFPAEILKQKEAKRERKKYLVAVMVCVSLAMIVFAGYQLFSYDIWSYISEKKMEALAAQVMLPAEIQVSLEHRIADLIASGLYTPKEAKLQAQKEILAQEERKTEETGILSRYSVLYERNQDLAGWIEIEDTMVNYPVMLTPYEEEYYLKKGFDKKYDINGIPFMDARCSVKEPTTNFLIYGHNMKNGSMFSTLLKYEQVSFYEEHPVIRFDTVYETGQYEIVGVFRTQIAFEAEETYRYYQFIQAEDQSDFDEFISYVKQQSFYETGVLAEYGDQLLTLSTCDRSIEEGRLVVVGRKQQSTYVEENGEWK